MATSILTRPATFSWATRPNQAQKCRPKRTLPNMVRTHAPTFFWARRRRTAAWMATAAAARAASSAARAACFLPSSVSLRAGG